MAGLTGSSPDKVLRFVPFFFIIFFIIFSHDLRAEDVLLTVNIKKPLALTSDKFLSYTLDPTVVLTGDALMKNSERSTNMAKALAPAYVRVGGPRSNSYTFKRTYRLQDEEDPGFTFTEANWMNVHRWAENSGLDVLACIAPQHSESGGRDTGWDSRNALDLISFSDHVGLNTSWQLGYECQTRCDVAGSDIGKDVIRLRSMLDAFPRYSQSIIAGPDVVTYRTKHQQQYLQDFFTVAGTALSAITWHPDFASITLDAEGVSMHHDNLALDRDSMYRVVGRLISKKPLWLAESKPEECKRQFLGALVWTRRLGNAAKLGVQVLMRQPDGSDLFQPTPDYWVSVLHKTLVGREVLDTKIMTGNRSHVHFYCQCTKPSSKYEKGSLTIFGINLTPVKVVANVKGVKVKTLHKYILLPGFDAENRMFSETVLLNNEPLNLMNESVLPEIKPAISNNSKGVTLKLPSGGIGFWVIPGLKIKSCGGLDEDNSDKMLSKKLTKRLDVADYDEESINEENGEEDEDEEHISSEERRHSTKSSKDKRRRKHRFSEEDDAERRSRKFEARMDLEKLEKLLRRRDNHDERKSPRVRTAYFGFEEKSHEKIIDEDDDETGAEIRSKLEEYKSRLRDYENRKKIEAKSRDRGKITDPSDSERIDSEKVTEALALILKMENTMKRFEGVNDQTPVDTLNPSVSYNVTSDLANPGVNRNPEDMFLDELLKSAKIKRTSVPSNIEVQLRTIYQMLAEERSRRQRNTTEAPTVEVARHIEEPLRKVDEGPSRNRRDTEKKFEDDPLGLRKEGLFRRRTKNEDVRDRRIERKSRRKDKDDRKDGQAVIFDPKTAVDSNENNFYGFHRREPLKGFPEGDMFFTTGTSSEENDKDYDYVRDDDDAQERERPRKIPKTSEKVTNQSDPDDTTWIEDENTQLNHVPHEFFEDIKMALPRVQENLKEYGELWEAEALGELQDDHHDHFNDGDEKATVEKIVQEHRFDAHEDKRAKETTVRKLIGYYENPRSHREEVTDYYESEKNEKSQTGMRTSPRNTPSEIQDKKPSKEPTAIRKRVKDLPLNEYGGLTNFDSMHFGRERISSTEDEPLYDVEYPVVRPAIRTKRSTDDLQMILDQEMIFQDDNNLKDCECRVIRGTRASRRKCDREQSERSNRSGRPERWRDEDRVARAERRKQRNRDALAKPGARSRFDEDYMHARSKRQARSSGEDVKKLIVVEPNISIEYPGDESDSPVKGSESGEVSREGNVNVKNANDNASRETPNNFNGADEDRGNVVEKVVDDVEKIKNLAVEEENPNFTVENAAENSDGGNILKRNDETEAIVTQRTESTDGSTERRKKSISPASEDVKALSVKSLSDPEETTGKSPKDSKADQSFLGTESENNQKSSSPVDEVPDSDAVSTAFEVDESLQSAQTPSSENNQSIVEPRSNGSEANVKNFLPVTISKPGKEVEEEIEPLEQENGEISMTSTTDNILEDQKTSIYMTEAYEKGTVSDAQIKLDDDGEYSTDVPTTESDTTLSIKKEISKSVKFAKDSPRMPRKVQKTKQTVKLVDPSKAREARMAARSDALNALRKENDARKSKKSLEAASKLLLSEHTKFQSMQKKRAEQLEKIRDKLRRKRAKVVQEYRNEMLDESEEASNDEERNLKRREIIDMITHDDELRDIVDREKLEYLMMNQPINYETVMNESQVDKAAKRKKYVPEVVEIVRPLSEVRERKVKIPIQPITYSNDPKILSYASSDESTNSEAIRKALRDRIDLTDHKVKRRSGKIYYSVVESLENPRIYQYPRSTEHESGEEESNEHAETVKLEQALSRSSSSSNKYDVEENVQRCNEGVANTKENRLYKDYKKPHKISVSQEERDKGLMNSKYPPRLTRNTSNRKNKYMCLTKSLDANSNVNQDELFDVMKAKKQYDKTNDEFIAKNKYLKGSSYGLNSKYKSPKYARLSSDKLEVERGALVNSGKYSKDHHLKSDDNEESLQEIRSVNLRKSEESNDKVELCRNNSKKEDDEQQESDTEIIDDLDLDDVLNLSKYELLMLIPVRNYKKSRSRRHIANEIFSDQGNSASNEISVEMPLKKNEIDSLHKDLLMEEILGSRTENSEYLGQSTKSIDSNHVIETNNLISESSTVRIVKNSNKTEKSVPEMGNGEESRDNNVLPGLLEKHIPQLEATVSSGIIKVRHISESFNKFVDGFMDRFNNKQLESNKENQKSIKPATIENVPMNGNIFSNATTNLKKFFDFLSSIIHILRFV